MDIQALLYMAAMCCKNGRKDLACSILEQACNDASFSDGFNRSVQPVFPASQTLTAPACDNTATGNEGGLDGLDSFVADKGEIMPTPQGDMPASENTWNPSLHGDDAVALGQVIAVASAVFGQSMYLYEGEDIIVDPSYAATASDVLELYDDHALVPSVATASASEKPATLKPGRLTITL